MSLERPLFSVNPVLYDALSGEFTPSTDSQKQTLGRLMAATVLKGEYELMEFRGGWMDSYGVYIYSPSWAPNTTSRVESRVIGDNHEIMSTMHLLQSADDLSGLTISSPTSRYAETTLTILQGDPTTATVYELELGSKLDVARKAVATAAEAFYTGN